LITNSRLVFSLVLALGGSFVVVVNGWIFWETIIRKRRAPSPVPIVGGIFAAVGIALFPWNGTWMWAWIPIVVDWGGLPAILVAWRQGAFK
jgi:hypothetical protein